MSAALVDAVLASDLKPAGLRLVALVCAWHAAQDDARLYAGRARLARETGLSADQVQRWQHELERMGILEVVSRGYSANGRKTNTAYVMHKPGAPVPPVKGKRKPKPGAPMPPVNETGGADDWGHRCGRLGAPTRKTGGTGAANWGHPCPPNKVDKETPTGSLIATISVAAPSAAAMADATAAGAAAPATAEQPNSQQPPPEDVAALRAEGATIVAELLPLVEQRRRDGLRGSLFALLTPAGYQAAKSGNFAAIPWTGERVRRLADLRDQLQLEQT